jgi:hypothetical protein
VPPTRVPGRLPVTLHEFDRRYQSHGEGYVRLTLQPGCRICCLSAICQDESNVDTGGLVNEVANLVKGYRSFPPRVNSLPRLAIRP